MQNTMVREGGGEWPAGKKNEIRKLGEKMKNEGKDKKKENYIQKGGKGLINASFWASPQTYLSVGKK